MRHKDYSVCNDMGWDSDNPSQTCFICGIHLPNDLDEVNAHIDSCLASSSSKDVDDNSNNNSSPRKGKRRGRNSSSSGSTDTFETYTIAGQTRIRACSLLDGGYSDILGDNSIEKKKKSNKKEDAEDEDLNIDDDDTVQFGLAQFSETDLVQMNEEDEDDFAPPIATTNSKNTNKKGAVNTEDSSFVIDALKLRVKELEKSVQNIPQCRVCLGDYDTPLVSINCWHVHCEGCWMSTLGAKKLCPQCKVITGPGDLRRIYL